MLILSPSPCEWGAHCKSFVFHNFLIKVHIFLAVQVMCWLGLMPTMLNFKILHWFCPYIISELNRWSKYFITLTINLKFFKSVYELDYSYVCIIKFQNTPIPTWWDNWSDLNALGFVLSYSYNALALYWSNKGLTLSVPWIFPLCLLINSRINLTWQRTNLLTIKVC